MFVHCRWISNCRRLVGTPTGATRRGRCPHRPRLKFNYLRLQPYDNLNRNINKLFVYCHNLFLKDVCSL